MERAAFVQLVAEVMDSLPAFFRDRIANLGVEVMPLAPPELARSVGRHPWSLLGLYHGIPFGRRGPWYGNVLPDRVLIFQKPIERLARTEEEIRTLVRRVVIHEVGHYFGLSDAELHRLETEADAAGPPADTSDAAGPPADTSDAAGPPADENGAGQD